MAEVSIEVHSPSNASVKGSVTFSVIIANETAKPLPADTRIRYLKNSHYNTSSTHVGVVQPYTSTTANLHFTPRGGADIPTLSAAETLALESKQETWVNSTKSHVWRDRLVNGRPRELKRGCGVS